jgi:integrase
VPTPPTPPARLLDQVRWSCARRRFIPRTADAYAYWTRRFVVFHGLRHPRELGHDAVVAFLDSLLRTGVSASTHSQALNALVFLYRNVLALPFGWLDELQRPRRPRRLPAVLSAEEVSRVLAAMPSRPGLMAWLIYGSGLRLQECLELRIKDIAWAR